MAERRLGRFLRVKRRYVGGILSGAKRSTIRLGIIRLTSNRLYVECGGLVYGEVIVDSIKYAKLSELSEEDAVVDGFESLGEMREALTGIYPGIGDEDWVTVIRFRLVAKYERPVSRYEVEEGWKLTSWDYVLHLTKLAKMYNMARDAHELRVLNAIASSKSLEEACESLGGVSDSYVKAIVARMRRRLRRIGVV